MSLASAPPAKVWGPLSTLGLAIAALAFGTDQSVKYWLLNIVDMPARQRIEATAFFDVVMAWNHGVSYGFMKTHTQALLIALSLCIAAFLWFWLARTARALTAAALGLIIGGALSNALDRVVHGAVADFFYFHLQGLRFAPLDFVFNPADVAIVAGVALLLYESAFEHKAR